MKSFSPQFFNSSSLSSTGSKSQRSFKSSQSPKKHSALVNLSNLLPNGNVFIQYSQLLELYQDFSGSQFIDLLTALDIEFPQIIALDKNHRTMKPHQTEDLLQFGEMLEMYLSVTGPRFSETLTFLAELYTDIVPIGKNQITTQNANIGNFLQYGKLLDLYKKKQCFEFTRRLKAISEEYLQIIPIDFRHHDVDQAHGKENQFLQYAEIYELYDELSGSQFYDLLSSLQKQFPDMIPIGHSPKMYLEEDFQQKKNSENDEINQEYQEIDFKQYKQIHEMYLDFNGVKFVKHLNELSDKYPQMVPKNWGKENAQNQHFLQYEELIELYLELSGSQFVGLIEGLIRQYPNIIPVGEQNLKEEIAEICRFLQFGELLELHSELSGDQFGEMLKGLAKQYTDIVILNSRHHVNLSGLRDRADFMQFSDLSEMYSDRSGAQFRQLLQMLSDHYPEIAPTVEQDQRQDLTQRQPLNPIYQQSVADTKKGFSLSTENTFTKKLRF